MYFKLRVSVILHPYLPITAITPHRPLSSVPKVAGVRGSTVLSIDHPHPNSPVLPNHVLLQMLW